MKNTIKMVGMAAIALSMGIGCGSHYQDAVDVASLPTASLNFGAASMPSGSVWFLDIQGNYKNGTAGLGDCRETFGNYYALDATAGHQGDTGPDTQTEQSLCAGVWNLKSYSIAENDLMTEFDFKQSVKLRDSNAMSDDTTVGNYVVKGHTPLALPAAICEIQGTVKHQSGAADTWNSTNFVDKAGAKQGDFSQDLRLRPYSAFAIRINCTSGTAAISFDVAVNDPDLANGPLAGPDVP